MKKTKRKPRDYNHCPDITQLGKMLVDAVTREKPKAAKKVRPS